MVLKNPRIFNLRFLNIATRFNLLPETKLKVKECFYQKKHTHYCKIKLPNRHSSHHSESKIVYSKYCKNV